MEVGDIGEVGFTCFITAVKTTIGRQGDFLIRDQEHPATWKESRLVPATLLYLHDSQSIRELIHHTGPNGAPPWGSSNYGPYSEWATRSDWRNGPWTAWWGGSNGNCPPGKFAKSNFGLHSVTMVEKKRIGRAGLQVLGRLKRRGRRGVVVLLAPRPQPSLRRRSTVLRL